MVKNKYMSETKKELLKLTKAINALPGQLRRQEAHLDSLIVKAKKGQLSNKEVNSLTKTWVL